MIFFVACQDLYSTWRGFKHGPGTACNGHIIPQTVGGLNTAPAGYRGDRTVQTVSTTNTTVESTIDGSARIPGTGGYGIDTEYAINDQNEFVTKDGKVVGRRPRSDESYGMDGDFIVNDKGQLISQEGQVIGRPPAAGDRFGIDVDFIINMKGEHVRKDGKVVGRPPRSGDYSINEKGQYIIRDGTILDHAPNSGEYIINEFGEFVTRDGQVIGQTIEEVGGGEVTSSEKNVSVNTSIGGASKLSITREGASYAMKESGATVDGLVKSYRVENRV